MKFFLLSLLCFASCGVRDTFDALEANRQAIDRSTSAISENIRAIEEANQKIEENRRHLDAINELLQKEHQQ